MPKATLARLLARLTRRCHFSVSELEQGEICHVSIPGGM